MQMDLGVLEGQTRGGYFLDSIFDPSVNQCSPEGSCLAGKVQPWMVVAWHLIGQSNEDEDEVLSGFWSLASVLQRLF